MSGNLTLTLTLTPKTIAGCIDIIEAFTGEPEDDPIEVILQNVFKTLIVGLVEDGVIKLYDTDEEAEERISPYFEHLGELREKTKGELAEIEATMSGENKVSEDNLLEGIEVKEAEETEESQTINENLTFESLPPDDPLVVKVSGDERMQNALVLLYSQIPRQFWGTEKAKEFLQHSLEEDK